MLKVKKQIQIYICMYTYQYHKLQCITVRAKCVGTLCMLLESGAGKFQCLEM